MNKLNTIFVLGYPRSGTTWFANLFNSHPDVAYRHEVIGRCFKSFPGQLFFNLKYNYGLTDEEHKRALDVVLSPNVESDRAPFFPKNHLRLNNSKQRYFFWLAAKTLGFLKPLYRRLYYPSGSALSLIIKETRSSVNLDSMLIGLRADSVVVLFRHPCGAIASFLNGINSGAMGSTDAEERGCWYHDNNEKPYLVGLNLSEQELIDLPEHKYLAVVWAQQNEDYLEFNDSSYDRFFVGYEAFMIDKEEKIKRLFAGLSLGYDTVVEEFIRSTSASAGTTLKDSPNKFYSVYRDAKFDPHKWKKNLKPEVIADIEALTMTTYDKLIAMSEKEDSLSVTASVKTESVNLSDTIGIEDTPTQHTPEEIDLRQRSASFSS